MSQQKEIIWGGELTADYDISAMFPVGGLVGYVEGKYDADRDGTIEQNEYLPNNRITSTWHGLTYLTTSFENGVKLRTEVEAFSGRDRVAQKLDGVALVNVAVSKKFASGELNAGVRNLFDTDYVNPTASATRGADVPGLGRSFGISYTHQF